VDEELRSTRRSQTLGRPPSLKLLGFKPHEGHLKVWETIKHSYFAYPDEDVRVLHSPFPLLH